MGRRLLYKVLEPRPRSQCVVVMAVSVCILNAMLLCAGVSHANEGIKDGILEMNSCVSL